MFPDKKNFENLFGNEAGNPVESFGKVLTNIKLATLLRKLLKKITS